MAAAVTVHRASGEVTTAAVAGAIAAIRMPVARACASPRSESSTSPRPE
jgi:hypothetical protein